MGQDVIVVGARVAGAATALLLARYGLRVRLVDRAGFPSDTLSSHQVQLSGVALLNRWGLLDRLRAAGVPPTRRIRFDADPVLLDGVLPGHDGVAQMFSPRRTLLDQVLIEAAIEAGAEFSPRLRVEELVGGAGRVTGVRGTTGSGTRVTDHARLVVGADGKHSLVAAATGARAYRVRPARCFACYSYWSGLPLPSGELYQRPGLAAAAFPTNDGLSMVYLSAPLSAFAEFRRDAATNFHRALDRCADLGERVRAAGRAERLRTTPDQPNRFHVPYGPGWALVGDAGVVMDSISAQGISNALRDADLLAGAIASELAGRRSPPTTGTRIVRYDRSTT